MLASPRRTQQVGCSGLWPGEHHERRLRLCLSTEEKGSLGRTEPIVLASRGRPLNSREPERVRRPTTGQRPRNRRFDPSIDSNRPRHAPTWFDPSINPTNHSLRQLGLTFPSIQRTMPAASLRLTFRIGPKGQCPASGPVPVAPNKLGAWGCGLVSTTSAG